MNYNESKLNPQIYGRYDNSNKTQLPNFDHFIRTVGQPDLAYRGVPRLDPAFASPPTGQSSLPTPPATTGQYFGWPVSDNRRDLHNDCSSAIVEDGDTPITVIDAHRRASFVQQGKSRHQPRPVRSYSSVQSASNGGIATTWRPSRVVNEQEVPGKGICYIYDDGTICPKEINGDTVNPKWGTTKAGKPRKRLGQACNACRDKKIRCDPQAGNAKCTQCLRSNRECRFSDGSRQGHRSPKFRTSTDSPITTNISSPNEYVSSRKSSIAPSEVSIPTNVTNNITTRLSDAMEGVLSPEMSDRDISDAPTPSKRQRMSPSSTGRAHESSRGSSRQDSLLEDARQIGIASDLDPAQHNVTLTKEYINCFLEFVNVPTFEIFPPNRFRHWVFENRNKSRHDRIMLYAAMAWGTIHSDQASRTAHREIFKQVVYSELEHIEFDYCLQTVHTLLFLTFVEFADRQHSKGFGIFVRCVGAILAMQLNVEKDGSENVTVYGFSPSMYAECCRRSYWAVFCADAFSGLSSGNPRMLHTKDIFLRLPCTRELYEADKIPTLPMSDHDEMIPRSLSPYEYPALGNLAWLLQIATICSEVRLNAWRSQNNFRIGHIYTPDREIRGKLEKQLEHWARSYNEGIMAKEGRQADAEKSPTSRIDSAARAQKFSGLDIMFHYAHMELNRRVYHKRLSEKELILLAKHANINAVDTLMFAQQILQRGGTDTRDYIFVVRGPLTGYCIHTAIDIVTAAGRTADILEPRSKMMTLMYNALEVLEILSKWWASARQQYIQVKERIQLVFHSAHTAAHQRKQFFYCSHSMVRTVDTDFDLIYGMDRKQYLRAAYEQKAVNEADVYDIITREKDVSSPDVRGA